MGPYSKLILVSPQSPTFVQMPLRRANRKLLIAARNAEELWPWRKMLLAMYLVKGKQALNGIKGKVATPLTGFRRKNALLFLSSLSSG